MPITCSTKSPDIFHHTKSHLHIKDCLSPVPTSFLKSIVQRLLTFMLLALLQSRGCIRSAKNCSVPQNDHRKSPQMGCGRMGSKGRNPVILPAFCQSLKPELACHDEKMSPDSFIGLDNHIDHLFHNCQAYHRAASPKDKTYPALMQLGQTMTSSKQHSSSRHSQAPSSIQTFHSRGMCNTSSSCAVSVL